MFSTTLDHVLAPSVALAFEFAKASGADKGVYLELGIAPAVPMADDAPVSVTIPVKVGLSLKDYYGEDTFGYFSAGLNIGKSISDSARGPRRRHRLCASATRLKFYNNDKAGQVVASVGFSVGLLATHRPRDRSARVARRPAALH